VKRQTAVGKHEMVRLLADETGKGLAVANIKPEMKSSPYQGKVSVK